METNTTEEPVAPVQTIQNPFKKTRVVLFAVTMVLIIVGIGGYFYSMQRAKSMDAAVPAESNELDTPASEVKVIREFAETLPTTGPSPYIGSAQGDGATTEKSQISMPQETREQLVLLGGHEGDDAGHIDATSKIVEAYNPVTNTWSRLPDMLYPRSEFDAVTLGDHIYVFGYGVKNRYNVNTSEFYNAKTNTWTEIEGLPEASSNILDIQAFAWGKKIFLIYSKASSNDLSPLMYAYDTIEKTYTKLSAPEKNVEHCFISYGEIYCMRRDDTTVVYKYVADKDWEKIFIENRSRVAEGITSVANSPFAIIQINTGAKYIARFDIQSASFRPSTNQFSPPEGDVFGVALGTYGNALVIAGGQINMDVRYEAQSKVYIYQYGEYLTDTLVMKTRRADMQVVTLPLPSTVQGGSITGKITERGSEYITRNLTISLYKTVQQFEGGGKQTVMVGSQNIGSDGTFIFAGLGEGEYELYAGGAYNSYSSESSQNPIKLEENQKIEVGMTASK